MKQWIWFGKILWFAGFLLVILWMLPAVQATPMVEVKFAGVGTSVKYQGVYAGFYTVEMDEDLDGQVSNGSEALVVCDDYSAHVYVGLVWQASIYTYQEIESGTANVKFASFSDYRKKYSQIGWLFSQMLTADPASQARYNAAIWNIMTQGSIILDSEAQGYYDAATSGAYDDFDYSGVMVVLTPDPHTASQEYLMQVTTPEPGTFVLIGVGLLGILVVTRRRKKACPAHAKNESQPNLQMGLRVTSRESRVLIDPQLTTQDSRRN